MARRTINGMPGDAEADAKPGPWRHAPGGMTGVSSEGEPGRSDLPRRKMLAGMAATLLAPAVLAQAPPRIIVIGGGFGGASCARALRRLGLAVTLVEANPVYTACPLSNGVLTGLREMGDQQFSYAGLERAGVMLVRGTAAGIDATARSVQLADGSRMAYDRLVVAPGIDFRFDAIAGYSEAASHTLPHAWKAGAQTILLRDQLAAMRDGGLFVISVPDTPYRCPPAPYERASLVAHYFKAQKPRSKIILLDAKDVFPRRAEFQEAWQRLYPGMVEWVPLSSSGKVTSVDVAGMVLTTDFDSYACDVANIIPPQKAGRIAHGASLADRSGWCPVNALTFESLLVPGVHVIGDAMTAGPVPRSASAAQAEGRACAGAIAAMVAGADVPSQTLASTCYAFAAPEEAFPIRGHYAPGAEGFAEVAAAPDAPSGAARRASEAENGRVWFEGIGREVFG